MFSDLIFSTWPETFWGALGLALRTVVLVFSIWFGYGRIRRGLWWRQGSWQGPSRQFFLLGHCVLGMLWALTGWWPFLLGHPILYRGFERYGMSLRPNLQIMQAEQMASTDWIRQMAGFEYTDEQWAARILDLPWILAERDLGRAMSDEEVTSWRKAGVAKEEAAAAKQKSATDHRNAASGLTKAARNGKPARRAVVLELAEPLVVGNAEGSSPEILSGIVAGHVEMLRHWPEEKGRPSPPLFVVGVTIEAYGQTIVTGGITDVSGLFQPEHFTKALWWADAPEHVKQEDAAGALFGPVWINGQELADLWQGEVGGRKVELLPGTREHGFALSIRPDGKTMVGRIFGLLANPDDATSCLPPFYFELPLVILLKAPKVERRTAEVMEDGTVKYSEPL